MSDVRDASSDQAKEQLQPITADLDFLSAISQTPALTNEEIAAYFLNHSTQPTKQYIQSYYQPLSSSDNGDITEYAQNTISYQSWFVDYITYVAENGCASATTIDAACADSLELPEELSSNYNQVEPAMAASQSLRQVVSSRLIENSLRISADLSERANELYRNLHEART